jgi:hypothetical protein
VGVGGVGGLGVDVGSGWWVVGCACCGGGGGGGWRGWDFPLTQSGAVARYFIASPNPLGVIPLVSNDSKHTKSPSARRNTFQIHAVKRIKVGF